jgi:hypothetical protein
VAVALSVIESQRAGFLARAISRRAAKIKLLKFFGKCLMPDGSTAVIVVKTASIQEANVKLHKGYRINVVLDILTEAEMPREWAKLKPSLIQRSQLR